MQFSKVLIVRWAPFSRSKGKPVWEGAKAVSLVMMEECEGELLLGPCSMVLEATALGVIKGRATRQGGSNISVPMQATAT